MGYATLLAITPAQMSCGEFLACQNDMDCDGARVCRETKDEETKDKLYQCIDPHPIQQQHVPREPAIENACDNSPLTGNYLHSTGCLGGTPTRFQEFPCEGYWSDFRGGFSLSYSGSTINGYEVFRSEPRPAVINLRRDITREDFGTMEEYFNCDDEDQEEGKPPCYGPSSAYAHQTWEVDILRLICSLEENPELYLAEVNGTLSINSEFLMQLASQPWTDAAHCRAMMDYSWEESCKEQFPYPTP